tara:strand:+ start:315 stop:674 length:360 start_codon:yes stop_codon:yes gene_type:complete
MNVNKAILVGRVGADPLARETAKGDTVINLSLATNSGYGDNQKTDWHKVTFFGKLADTVQEYVTKGQELYIEGRITYNKFTDREGNEREGTSVIANMMQMGSNKNGAKSPAEDDESVPF